MNIKKITGAIYLLLEWSAFMVIGLLTGKEEEEEEDARKP